MKSRKLPILLALIALVAAALACAAGELSLSNTRIASDQNGDNAMTQVGTMDKYYVVSDISNAPTGTVVNWKWYAVNIEGFSPNEMIAEKDFTVDEDGFSGVVYLENPAPDGGWPVGDYKFEVYLNGELKDTVTYSVK